MGEVKREDNVKRVLCSGKPGDDTYDRLVLDNVPSIEASVSDIWNGPDIFDFPDAPKVETEREDVMVNHPPHYTNGDIECIRAIEASMSKEEFRGYLKGSCIKYLWRYKLKENPKRDLGKCEFYLKELMEVIDE